MVKKKERHDLLFDKFKEEILDKFIETNHLDKSYMGSPDYRSYTSLNFCSCNSHYKESIFYYKKEKKFIHFTSLEKLKLILDSNTLRLHNLVNQNDPNEFKYSANFLGIEEQTAREEKQNLFILSMCEYHMKDDLTMWRLYGDKTKGVGIVIDFEDDLIEWIDFHLSSVFYKEVEIITNYLKEKDEFEKNNDFKFFLPLNRFLSFFKPPDFTVENEIRLLYYYRKDELLEQGRDRIKNYNSQKYLELQLSNKLGVKYKNENYLYKQSPKPKINTVILGPNLDNFNLLNNIKKDHIEVKFQESSLRNKFRV